MSFFSKVKEKEKFKKQIVESMIPLIKCEIVSAFTEDILLCLSTMARQPNVVLPDIYEYIFIYMTCSCLFVTVCTCIYMVSVDFGELTGLCADPQPAYTYTRDGHSSPARGHLGVLQIAC